MEEHFLDRAFQLTRLRQQQDTLESDLLVYQRIEVGVLRDISFHGHSCNALDFRTAARLARISREVIFYENKLVELQLQGLTAKLEQIKDHKLQLSNTLSDADTQLSTILDLCDSEGLYIDSQPYKIPSMTSAVPLFSEENRLNLDDHEATYSN